MYGSNSSGIPSLSTSIMGSVFFSESFSSIEEYWTITAPIIIAAILLQL